jgi:hypothetical protein
MDMEYKSIVRKIVHKVLNFCTIKNKSKLKVRANEVGQVVERLPSKV